MGENEDGKKGWTIRWSAASVLPRACIGILLTLAVLYYIGAGAIFDRISAMSGAAVGGAIAIFAAQYVLSAWRWYIVATLLGVRESAMQLQSIFGAGALADLVALTSAAGLAVRGVMLVTRGSPAPQVILVLLVERAFAMAGLALCFLAGVAATGFLHGPVPVPRKGGAIALVLAGVMAAVLIAVYMLARMNAVKSFVASIRASFLTLPATAGLALLSCAIVWLGFAAVALLAHGLGLEIEWSFFLTVMPVIALLAALPVSIGGWGVRESAMVAGLAIFGIEPEAAAALSITYGLLGVIVTICLGGAGAAMLNRGGK